MHPRLAIGLAATAAAGAFLLAFAAGKATKDAGAERSAPAQLAAASAPESRGISTDAAIGDDLPALPEMRKPKPRRSRPAGRPRPAGGRPQAQQRVPTPQVQPTARPRAVAPPPRNTTPQVQPRDTAPKTNRPRRNTDETIGGSVN